jgi:transposase-like protein
MGYSLDRRSAVLKRMLPPNNVAIRQLSQEEGISEATLHKWRADARGKGQLLPDADASPDGWSSLSTNGIKATGFQPVRFSVMYYNLPSHF